MRRVPLVAAVLGAATFAGAATAQVGGPEVAGITGPIAVRGRIEGDAAHGCSLSHESVRREADLDLVVDASGGASLHLMGMIQRVSGPSFGAYRAGDHDFSEVTELHETRWTGIARAGAGELRLELVDREAATARVAGFGRPPLGAPVRSLVALLAVCRIGSMPVLPATTAPGEAPTAHALLGCRFHGGLPDPLDRYADGEIVLGAGRGVRTLVRDPEWGASSTELRQAE